MANRVFLPFTCALLLAMASHGVLFGQESESSASLLERSGERVEAGDLDEGLLLAERALDARILERGEGSPGVAIVHFRLARIHEQRGDADSAIAAWEQGLVIDRDLFALTSLALLLFDRPREDARTEELLLEAIEVATEMFRDDRRLLHRHYSDLGGFYLQRGRMLEAVDAYEEAVDILSAGLGDDNDQTATARLSLGLAYHRAGRLSDASHQYDLAGPPLFFFPTEENGEHPLARRARIVTRLRAYLLRDQGHLTDAANTFATYLDALSYDSAVPELQMVPGLLELVDLNIDLGNYSSAGIFAARLLAATQDPAASPMQQAQTIGAWARAQRYMRLYADTEAFLAQVRPGFDTDSPEQFIVDAQRAYLLRDMGDLEAAEALFLDLEERVDTDQRSIFEAARRRMYIEAERWHEARALHWAPEAPAQGRRAGKGDVEDWIDHGFLTLQEGNAEEAVAAFTVALDATVDTWLGYQELSEAMRGFMTETYDIHAEEKILALRGRAAAQVRLQDLAAAQQDLAVAVQLAESLADLTLSEELQEAVFRGQHSDVFSELVSVSVGMGDVEGALFAAESARGSQLVSRIYEGGFQTRIEFAGGDEEGQQGLRDALAAAEDRVSSLQSQVRRTQAGAPASPLLNSLADSLLLADRALLRARTQVGSVVGAGPGRFGGTWADSIPLGEVHARMGTSTEPVLVYHVGTRESFVFVLDGPSSLDVFPIEVDASQAAVLGIEEGTFTSAAAVSLTTGPNSILPNRAPDTRSVEVGGTSRATLGYTPERSRALRNVLVPDPVWDRLKGADGALVVPDGALHLLPFDLLAGEDLGSGPPFWADSGPSIRYASSLQLAYILSLFMDDLSLWSEGQRTLLSVSNPDFELADIEPEAGTRRTDRGAWLTPLPGTAAESDSLKAIFGGTLTRIQGAGATEASVRAALSEGYPLLHFATHGLVDESRSGLFASLAFTPGGEGEAQNDGLLQLHELYELPFRGVDLAVLSACDTNRGTVVGGEGVFALSRGFLGGGTKRVLATQWPVDDEATAAFVAAFFRVVGEQLSALRTPDYGVALRRAQELVRTHPDHPEWADPFYWAPFILIGKR